MRNLIADIYDQFILSKPLSVLIVLSGVFVFFSYYAKDFDLDASADTLMLEGDEDLRKAREIGRRYAGNEFLFVTFTPKGDVFSDESLHVIRELRDKLRQVTNIESVLSILDVPLVTFHDGPLSQIAGNYRTLQDEDVDREKAREELTQSPIYKELVISEDGRTTALVLYLEDNPQFRQLQYSRNDLIALKHTEGLSDEQAAELKEINRRYQEIKEAEMEKNHRMIADIRSIIAGYEDHGSLHLGGLPMIADDMITFIKNDLLVFGLGVFLFMIVMLTVIFRQLRWVALPLLSCVFAGLLMIGLLGFIGWDVTVISSNFISLMLILTLSMNIHLVVRYRQLRRDNPHEEQSWLVSETTRKMVWPCLYTALTTMIGFSSLVFSNIKPVIDFGWMMTMGLAVTFLTSFLLFPAVLIMLGRSESGHAQPRRVPFTAALAGFTERHGGKVIAVSVVLAVIAVFGMTRLMVENSFVNYFSEDTEIYQGLKLIDEKLGGTTTLDIILKFDRIDDAPAVVKETAPDEEGFPDFEAAFGDVESSKADSWFTPDRIDLVKGVHDYLDGLEAVGKVLSLASTVRVAEDVMDGQEFTTFEMAILYKRLPADLKESMIDPYVSLESDEARITLRIRDSLEDLRRDALLKRIHRDLKEKFDLTEDEFEVTGLLVLYNNMLQSLFKSQILTLGVVMLGIALMLLVLFRSLSLAVIGIIPNILAAGAVLGLMGLAGIPLDMMTITIAAITIGIAVDNSIHYIYRFREELPKHGGDYIATLHYCHANIGSAVFYTACTIIIGFSILVMSNFIPTIYFGLLTALAMFLALLAALTLLPRLILWWGPFGR